MEMISASVIPLIVICVTIYGLIKKRSILNDFTEGAVFGLKTVFEILPILIALIISAKVFCGSGLCGILTYIIPEKFIFPKKLIPLIFLKAFSSSAALGYTAEIFKSFGTDSFEGLTASIMLACTETVFYTISVYFGSIGIKKTRYVLPCAIISMICGAFVSAVIALHMV